MWCVAEIDDEYIARMEDVLATYERPLSYKEPVVCVDEKPIQLLKNVNSTSRMVRKGKPRRKDYEYKRKGTANAFCVVEPKRGRYMVKITKNRKADQFAEIIRHWPSLPSSGQDPSRYGQLIDAHAELVGKASWTQAWRQSLGALYSPLHA